MNTQTHQGWSLQTSCGISKRPPTFCTLCVQVVLGQDTFAAQCPSHSCSVTRRWTCCSWRMWGPFVARWGVTYGCDMSWQLLSKWGLDANDVCTVRRGGYTVVFHVRYETSWFSLERRWHAGHRRHLSHILMCMCVCDTLCMPWSCLEHYYTCNEPRKAQG